MTGIRTKTWWSWSCRQASSSQDSHQYGAALTLRVGFQPRKLHKIGSRGAKSPVTSWKTLARPTQQKLKVSRWIKRMSTILRDHPTLLACPVLVSLCSTTISRPWMLRIISHWARIALQWQRRRWAQIWHPTCRGTLRIALGHVLPLIVRSKSNLSLLQFTSMVTCQKITTVIASKIKVAQSCAVTV